MQHNFRRDKRKVEETKKKRRDEKNIKRLNKKAEEGGAPAPEIQPQTPRVE
jgi:hypothetical protein